MHNARYTRDLRLTRVDVLVGIGTQHLLRTILERNRYINLLDGELSRRFSCYEAHPVSKVPWGRLQKQNTI
jgi:hypothetical protein